MSSRSQLSTRKRINFFLHRFNKKVMGACFQPMMYPQPPTFNVHLPPNATPTVKVVFATEDPEPISEEEEEEVLIATDDLVQISLPT
jgi:hypothetical protein